MSTLVLIRHGQSQWNLENRFTGWTDVDLTEQGRKDAAKAAEAATPLGAAAAALYERFVEGGQGGLDFSGIIKMIEAGKA